MFQNIMRILSTLLSLYSLTILVRIVLTWMPGGSFGRVGLILAQVTDPYLNLFRRVKFLSIGHIDFSPVIGLILLSIANRIASALAFSQEVSWAIVVALFIQAIMGAIGFFCVLFALVAGVRLIGLKRRRTDSQRFWYSLDHLLQPMAYRVANLILRGRPIKYTNTLVLFIGTMLLIMIVTRLLSAAFIGLLLQAQA